MPRAGCWRSPDSEVPGVEFVEADFTDLPMADGSFDVVIAAHALLFADDRVAALREWLRVVAPGGRISLSVPGPGDVVPATVLHRVYDQYGIIVGQQRLSDDGRARGLGDAGGLVRHRDGRRPDDRHPAGGRRPLPRLAERRASRSRDRRLEPTAPRRVRARPHGGHPALADGGYWLPFGALYLTARRAR